MRYALLVVLLCACAARKPPTGEPPRGQVLCVSDKHYAFIRTDALAGPEGPAILAHEQHHLMQARMLGGCEAWQTFIDTPANLARAEAGAFCVSAVVISSQGLTKDLTTAVDHYARQLSGAYPHLNLTVDAAREMIWEFCT